MITLRHHLLTIVAVFLALAAGIVLGGGPLSDVGATVATAGSGEEPAPAGDRAQTDFTDELRVDARPADASAAGSPTGRWRW